MKITITVIILIVVVLFIGLSQMGPAMLGLLALGVAIAAVFGTIAYLGRN